MAVVAVGLGACGDDDPKSDEAASKKVATPLAITTSDAGAKRFRTEAPKSIKGGLVRLTFKNAGKARHHAQLIRVEGTHTAKEVIGLVAEENDVIPDWVQLAGGVGSTAPGQTASATMNLQPGRYMMVDTGEGEPPVPATAGAFAEFEVTAGEEAPLPQASATITAATDEAAADETATTATGGHAAHKHSFEISGLKVGHNKLRLVNEGEEVHHAVLFLLQPGSTAAEVKKFFTTEGRPSGPPPVDFESGANTAVLSGDSEQVADLVLPKAGKYAVVCFLKDRDGKGKRHLAEGMLKVVDVK